MATQKPDYLKALVEQAKKNPLSTKEVNAKIDILKSDFVDSTTKMAERDLLCKALYPTIDSLATHYSLKFASIEYNDLFNAGIQGALDAIEHFEPAKSKSAKATLSTYAYPFVKDKILQECSFYASSVSLSKPTRCRVKRLQLAKEGFIKEHHREPSEAELSELTGFSVRFIQEYRNGVKKSVSIETRRNPGNADDNSTFLDEIDKENPQNDLYSTLYKNDSTSLLYDSIAKLPEREQIILNLRFGLNGEKAKTLEAIGQKLRISPETVRRITNASLVQLKAIYEQSDTVA